MEGFWICEFHYWNEDTKLEDGPFYGTVFAKSYSDAADKVEGYYGDELVDLKLTPLEPFDILPLSKEEALKLIGGQPR
jgi:hypothetical protein